MLRITKDEIGLGRCLAIEPKGCGRLVAGGGQVHPVAAKARKAQGFKRTGGTIGPYDVAFAGEERVRVRRPDFEHNGTVGTGSLPGTE